MLDGDEAGRNAATEAATRLAHRVWVRIADVAEATQPDRPIKRPCAADCVGIFYY
jgi:DNA primase